MRAQTHLDRGHAPHLTAFHGDARHDLVLLMLGMYREMPGLKLTPPQAARLCGADEPDCRSALEHLCCIGELRRGTQGDYLARV